MDIWQLNLHIVLKSSSNMLLAGIKAFYVSQNFPKTKYSTNYTSKKHLSSSKIRLMRSSIRHANSNDANIWRNKLHILAFDIFYDFSTGWILFQIRFLRVCTGLRTFGKKKISCCILVFELHELLLRTKNQKHLAMEKQFPPTKLFSSS